LNRLRYLTLALVVGQAACAVQEPSSSLARTRAPAATAPPIVTGADAPGIALFCAEYASCVAEGRIESDDLDEISGIAASRRRDDVLYVHNDSGDSPRFFAIDRQGRTLAEFDLPIEGVSDVEDIATGPGPGDASYVYLGDIGDNVARLGLGLGRSEVRVHRVKEPPLPSTRGARQTLSTVETLRLVYPDHPHDAEALLVDPLSGDLFIVSKEGDGESRVFRAQAPLDAAAPRTLEVVASLDFGRGLLEGNPMVTAADISPDGGRILIRTYSKLFEWRRGRGQSVGAALRGIPRSVPAPQEEQGEAVAFSRKQDGYFTVSEKARQPLYFCACGADE
jgi:hypothetical protein